MDFDEWKPIYFQILDDFGFSIERDRLAASILSGLLEEYKGHALESHEELESMIKDMDVLVCGNAPCLIDDIRTHVVGKYTVIAADGATEKLMDHGIVPHIIVTDLDGNVQKEIDACRRGAIVVIHAHGDNIDTVKRYVPSFSKVIGTTQAEPLRNVYNFGGFTDGDRCVFLAHEFGALNITLAGFDFDDADVSLMKKKKLKWAKELIRIILDK